VGRAWNLGGVFVVLVLLAGCIGRTGEVRASLGSEFPLAIGETASVAGENLKVKFIEVTEDSRCPANVVCIQAGRAVMTVEVSYQDAAETLSLAEPGRSTPEITYQDYTLVFHLEPYPVAGVEVSTGQYRLLLRIDRK
jgi:uncharacterized protein (DUF342 family)